MTDAIGYGKLEQAGRYANQLWEVAATVGIARTHSLPIALPATWSYRRFLNVPADWFTTGHRRVADAHHFAEASHLDPRARPYMQDLALFAHCAEEIAEAFKPSPIGWELIWDVAADVVEASRDPAAIALHVRRGDLVENDPGYQPLTPLSYYQSASGRMDGPLFVFSDDPDWCEDELPAALSGRWITVVRTTPPRSHIPSDYEIEQATDWVDLSLMAMFPRHICSASTYAWWAAWLSDDPAPLYPSQWWGHHLDYIDTSLMFPPSWVEVPCS